MSENLPDPLTYGYEISSEGDFQSCVLEQWPGFRIPVIGYLLKRHLQKRVARIFIFPPTVDLFVDDPKWLSQLSELAAKYEASYPSSEWKVNVQLEKV